MCRFLRRAYIHTEYDLDLLNEASGFLLSGPNGPIESERIFLDINSNEGNFYRLFCGATPAPFRPSQSVLRKRPHGINSSVIIR